MLGRYSQVVVFCLTVLYSGIANAAGEDDVTPAVPIVDAKTVTKWRPYAFEVNADSNTLTVWVRGIAVGGASMPNTDTKVTVRGSRALLEGYAVDVVGRPNMCVLSFASVMGRSLGSVTTNLKKVVEDCF